MALLLLAASCKVHYKPRLAAVKPAGAPFYVLSDGRRIEGDPSATQTTGDGEKDGPASGNTATKMNSNNKIYEYQNHTGHYVDAPDGLEAVQIETGRIGLYRTRNTDVEQYYTPTGLIHYHTATIKTVNDYLRPGDTGLLVPMNYDNLVASMVNPGAGIRNELNEYVRLRNSSRKLNTIGYCTMGVGLGIMVAGIASKSNALMYGGFGLAAGGPAVLCVNLVRHTKNAKRLYTILGLYNRNR